MPGPAHDVIRQFGEVEHDQRYTRLLGLFTDDAVYYDPFLGAQRGTAAIRSFMEHMERVVPASGARFESWETEADTTCGWARWVMTVPTLEGERAPIPGQSLYRLRDGKVCGVVDYVDAKAYTSLRGGTWRIPDAAGAAGITAELGPAAAPGAYPALDLVRRFWQIQDGGDYRQLSPLFADDAIFTDLVYGVMNGGAAIADYMAAMKAEMPARGISFELVDCAGDTSVAWSQWWCHFPNGRVPGWTLHTVRDGAFTLDADYFDTVAATALRGPAGG
jgi:ketosteroid isomerase-like protein